MDNSDSKLGPGFGFGSDGGHSREQEQEQYTASTNGSVSCGSSIRSGSQDSSPDPNYTTSPNKQYGSLTSVWSPGTQYDSTMMDAWTPNTQDDPRMSLWSPRPGVQSQEPSRQQQQLLSMKDLPLFNIEKEENPGIHWWTYYDFVATRTESYYQLRQGVNPTESRPERRACEKVIIGGKWCYPCRVPSCSYKKAFTRYRDLERHFETFHQVEREQIRFINCDYKNCPHTEPFRKDHCREHYREYHNEDLLKRGRYMESKTDRDRKKARHNSLGNLERKAQTVAEFLESRRIGDKYLKWWRCSKCVLRVKVRSDGYTCPRCNVQCEAERKAWREKQAARIAENERSIAFDNGSQAGDSASDWAPYIGDSV